MSQREDAPMTAEVAAALERLCCQADFLADGGLVRGAYLADLALVTAALAQAAQARAQAYQERDRLVAFVAGVYPSHLKVHPVEDTTWEDDWRWIVCVHGPAGQMTWHIHDSELPMFDRLPRSPASDDGCQWDGHTTEEKYQRLAAALAQARAQAVEECARVAEQWIEDHGRGRNFPRTLFRGLPAALRTLRPEATADPRRREEA
jgi:hypothetical protein